MLGKRRRTRLYHVKDLTEVVVAAAAELANAGDFNPRVKSLLLQFNVDLQIDSMHVILEVFYLASFRILDIVLA